MANIWSTGSQTLYLGAFCFTRQVSREGPQLPPRGLLGKTHKDPFVHARVGLRKPSHLSHSNQMKVYSQKLVGSQVHRLHREPHIHHHILFVLDEISTIIVRLWRGKKGTAEKQERKQPNLKRLVPVQFYGHHGNTSRVLIWLCLDLLF